jgi:hypothetical protein
MKRDVLTLLTFGVVAVFIVFGYQNFDRAEDTTLAPPACHYTGTFTDLGELKNFTPIVYSLEDGKIWKGQSGAGPFQRISREADRVSAFHVVGSGVVEALLEEGPTEYILSQTRDAGENWTGTSAISELKLRGILFDAIEYCDHTLAAVKFLNGEKSFLRLMTRANTSDQWKTIKDIEVDEDTVAALAKDNGGRVYLAYTVLNRVFVESRTAESDFQPFASFEPPVPLYILPSSDMGIAADRNGLMRVFVNVGNSRAARPAVDTRTLLLSFDGKRTKMTEITDARKPNLITTHMAVSEDGTISLNGIRKSSAGLAAEAFLKVDFCAP